MTQHLWIKICIIYSVGTDRNVSKIIVPGIGGPHRGSLVIDNSYQSRQMSL
jgi:hypothetical protein